MEQPIPDPALLQNLADAGCDDETVKCYCTLEQREYQKPLLRKEQITLLRKHRRALLAQLHDYQKKLDCLDYLLYRLKDEGKNQGGEG